MKKKKKKYTGRANRETELQIIADLHTILTCNWFFIFSIIFPICPRQKERGQHLQACNPKVMDSSKQTVHKLALFALALGSNFKRSAARKHGHDWYWQCFNITCSMCVWQPKSYNIHAAYNSSQQLEQNKVQTGTEQLEQNKV